MKIWVVQMECDSSQFYFSTKKKANAFIQECAKNEEIPSDEVDNYFHLYEERLDP